MFASIFDCGKSADNSLVIGNILLFVKGDVEVNLDANRFSQLLPPALERLAMTAIGSLPE